MTISAKLFSILTNGFRGEDFKVFSIGTLWRLAKLTGGNVSNGSSSTQLFL